MALTTAEKSHTWSAKNPYSSWSPERKQLARDRANRHWRKVREDPEKWALRLAKHEVWRKAHPESHRKSTNLSAQRRRAWLADIKMASGCVDCGYRAAAEALHFDHLDPSQKINSVSQMMTVSEERVLLEVAKCVVRCANCHAIRTYRERHNRSRRATV